MFVDTCKFILSKQGNSGNVVNDKKNEHEKKIDLTGTIIPTDRKKKRCCGWIFLFFVWFFFAIFKINILLNFKKN